jgi:hypothetical protein
MSNDYEFVGLQPALSTIFSCLYFFINVTLWFDEYGPHDLGRMRQMKSLSMPAKRLAGIEHKVHMTKVIVKLRSGDSWTIIFILINSRLFMLIHVKMN